MLLQSTFLKRDNFTAGVSLICLLVILAGYSGSGVAMSLFSSKEVVLFSDVEGSITYDGKPISGATILRTSKWQKENSDSVITENDGSFRMPAITMSHNSLLPSQFVSHQRITVQYQGNDFVIWSMGKINPELDGELGGKKIKFTCELKDEMEPVDVPEGLLVTACKLQQ
ncbi:hypothetical protein M3P05_05115 [Sansalvadorimonas sp. 2012CJ34-2]|uniref:DUF6795 domain-containing protein n=1 Tax=Parendozoicomonas callyspongiae TaxID=2942213 RepID=A0ABT0PD85_9GAMM|nr:DUF6795 domain-containing protein [Sansalvadorimonas sp. 2012CJ34-2]MCL6269324.1 hypothetical protein [Sansalvadorimonas sp. 2012CJ34-2]